MAIKTWIATTASTWATAASWSPSGVPVAADDVIFNSTYSGDCSVGATATCTSVKMVGYSGTFSGTGALNITGANQTDPGPYPNSFAISSACTFTYSGTITFTNTNPSPVSSAYAIYCNGKSFNGPIVFNSASGEWHFWDVFTSTSSLTFTSGVLSSEADVYVGSISTSNSNSRQIYLNYDLYLTGSGTLITATTTTNLAWVQFGNTYVWGPQTLARSLTFNTVVYPTYSGYVELGGVGSGAITLAVGTTAIPRVGVTNTGGATVSFSTGAMAELIFSGGTNVVWSNSTLQTLTIDGDLTLVSTMGAPTLTPSFIFRGIGWALTNNSRITLAGKSLVTGTVTLNDSSWGAGLGTFTFLDAFSSNAAVTITSCASTNINVNFNLTLVTNTLTLTAGTLNVNNGANVTCGLFSSSNSNTRVLNMGSGTWTITGTGTVWNLATSTGMTLNAGQSRILINNTSATTVNFNSPGTFTYYTIEYARGGGGGRFDFLCSTGNTMTITNFINNTSTAAHIIAFGAGTYNFYKFNVRGSAGQLITISRSGANAPTITKVGQGIIPYCDYLNITPTTLTFTPANAWYAGANSTGSGAGWVMTAAPSSRSLLGAGGVG
jgi:hypothetical protein